MPLNPYSFWIPPLCANGQLIENECQKTVPLAFTVPVTFCNVKVMLSPLVVYVPDAEAFTDAVTSKFDPVMWIVWSAVSAHVFGDPCVSVRLTPLPDPVTVALPSNVCS